MRWDEEIYDGREVRARYRVTVSPYGTTWHDHYWEVVERLQTLIGYEEGLLVRPVEVVGQCERCRRQQRLPGMIRQGRLYAHDLLRCGGCGSIWYASREARVQLWTDYYDRRGVTGLEWGGGRPRRRTEAEIEAERLAKERRRLERERRDLELRQHLLAYLKGRGGVIASMSEAARGTGLSSAVVERILRVLAKEGLVRPLGGRTSQGQPYQLVERVE